MARLALATFRSAAAVPTAKLRERASQLSYTSRGPGGLLDRSIERPINVLAWRWRWRRGKSCLCCATVPVHHHHGHVKSAGARWLPPFPPVNPALTAGAPFLFRGGVF